MDGDALGGAGRQRALRGRHLEPPLLGSVLEPPLELHLTRVVQRGARLQELAVQLTGVTRGSLVTF